MFTPMRIALQTQRGLDNEAAIQAGSPVDELALDCADVLEAATIEGARALRIDDEVGSLTPGKKADVVTVRTDDVNMTPLHDPVAAVVLHARPGNVDDVFVDGERRKADGELLAPAVADRRADLIESGRRLLRAADVGE